MVVGLSWDLRGCGAIQPDHAPGQENRQSGLQLLREVVLPFPVALLGKIAK